MWTQAEAIDLCRRLEVITPLFGAHVGLTGGLLYKYGQRKDCDILLYRIRDQKIRRKELFAVFHFIGITVTYISPWLVKADLAGKRIDFLFPDEEDNGEYEHVEDDADINF